MLMAAPPPPTWAARPSRNARVAAEVELGVACFDAKEEAAARGHGEPGGVEHGVVGHRQAVEAEHPEDGGQRGEQDRQLERDRHQCRPASERSAADVDRVMDHRREVHHAERRRRAGQSADQHEQGQPVAREADRLGQAVDRHGRIGVHLPIPRRRRRASRGGDEGLGRRVFGHQAVDQGFIVNHGRLAGSKRAKRSMMDR